MKVNPYLHFNGNCEEALALYEKAFNTKTEMLSRYKDAPPSEGYNPPPGTDDWIMHAEFKLGDTTVMVCDMPGEDCGCENCTCNRVTVSVGLDSKEAAKATFDILREGGEVGMELQETFWSPCFGSLTDKFGIQWMITIGYCTDEK